MTGPRGDRARRRALAPGRRRVAARRRRPGGAALPGRRARGDRRAAGRGQVDARRARGRRRAGAGPRPRRPARRPRLARGARAPGGAALGAALADGGAVAVTTALREGHRLGLAKAAAAAGAPAHLVLLDADAPTCRAGRAAQGAPRIPDGLFEHLLGEWAAYRRALEASTTPRRSPRSPCSTGRPPTACAASRSHPRVEGEPGAGEGTRTPALSLTRRVLYQLSYSGARSPESRAAPAAPIPAA